MKLLLFALLLTCTAYADVPEGAQAIVTQYPAAEFVEACATNDQTGIIWVFRMPNPIHKGLWTYIDFPAGFDPKTFLHFAATAYDSQNLTIVELQIVVEATKKNIH